VSVAFVDSNIVIEIFKKRPDALAWYRTQSQLSISPITWIEVMYGAKGGRAERNAHERILKMFKMEYLTKADIDWAMNQLLKLSLKHDIDGNDYLIASVPYRLNIPLYTHNLKHMQPLPGSKLAINPY
jgi:predicted nucleic acid-binding protein